MLNTKENIKIEIDKYDTQSNRIRKIMPLGVIVFFCV